MSLTDRAGRAYSPFSLRRAIFQADPGQAVLLIGVLAAVLLLIVPVSLPIGPYYWDIAAYLDGAHRIAAGQVPHVDFGSPFGALTLLLYRAAAWAFPQAQPVLAAQYAILIAAAPLMALVLRDARGGAGTAAALAAPFILFALAPYNGTNLEPLIPGVDAFGIYNRQAGLLCYILLAALLFCRSPFAMGLAAAGALAALLFIKITAFASALGLIAFAALAGRMSLRAVLTALAGPVAAAVLMQLWGGLTTAYAASILDLSAYNTGSVAGRVIAVILMNLTILLPVAALGGVLAVLEGRRWLGAVGKDRGGWRSRARQLRSLLDSNFVWLALVAAFGVAVEHQNSGSNQFIYFWPVLLRVLTDDTPVPRAWRRLVVALILAAALPTLVATLQRAVRIGVVTLSYTRLDEPGLEAFGRVLLRPELLREAQVRSGRLAASRQNYTALTAEGIDLWPSMESHPAAQAIYLISVADAMTGLARFETANRLRLDHIAALDYFDPFATLLKREPVPGLPIAHDPSRTMSPERVAQTIDVLSGADGILVPRCRTSVQQREIYAALSSALKNRRAVAIAPCWALFLR